MSKHTPGPWFHEVHDLPLGKGRVISIQTRKSFDPDDEDDDPTLAGIYSLDPVDFANANLIAAAPDLLEALQAIMDITTRNPELWDMAREAIAKATGEQKC